MIVETSIRGGAILTNSNSAPDEAPYNFVSWVRRAEVRLRAEYPDLTNRIFEVVPHQFLIVLDPSVRNAATVDVEKIRPITLQLKISNTPPVNFLREIAPLDDNELGRNYEGVPFSRYQLLNLVLGKFPYLPIVDIGTGNNPRMLFVELENEIGVADQQKVLAFCRGIGAVVPFGLRIVGKKPILADKDALTVNAWRLRSSVPDFVKQDEEFWFRNLDQIFDGSLNIAQIAGIERAESRCFVDATVGNHLNLRQLLSMYDKIYISMPLAELHEDFLTRQAITENDVLGLIECGRLSVISVQAEERLNCRFLEAAAERSISGVIGRRTTAAIMLAKFIETDNNYYLSNRKRIKEVSELSEVVAEAIGTEKDKFLQFLLWPTRARRLALEDLFDRGSKGIYGIGLGAAFSNIIKDMGRDDLDLEFMMTSEKVHIGHSLQATVFPSREEPESLHVIGNMMGEALNFFSSFNSGFAAAWIGNLERRKVAKSLLPPLPIFEFDVGVPISEILDLTSRPSLRNRGLALFSRLADLGELERAEEIGKLQAALRRYGNPSGWISFDTADTAVGLASSIYGFLYPPLPGIQKLGNKLLSSIRAQPKVDRLIDAIMRDLLPESERKRELDFLSRINRVASLKSTRVA